MRIQLFCDQKWRDLPNITVLKLLLEERGHRVLVTNTKEALALMHVFRPDCVVFNHLFSSHYANLAKNLRDSGVAVALLPTEGAPFPMLADIAAGEFTDYSNCDLFLNWSEPVAALIRARWSVPAERAPVVGCTRFDFYTERFKSAITPRDAFLRRHGLSPDKPVVTWATQYAYASVGGDPAALEKFSRETLDFGVKTCLERHGIPLDQYPVRHALGRRNASDAFFRLAAARPEIQFIIRPHPAESRQFYLDRIAASALTNVGFCPEDYIWNILAASDLHLHRHCTTAVEAWTGGKPTVEMAMDPGALHWPEREAGSYMVRDTDDLIAIVDESLAGRTVPSEMARFRQAYVEEWFGPLDGRRCDHAAVTLHRFLIDRGARRSFTSALKIGPTRIRHVGGASLRYLRARTPNMRALGPVRRAARDDKQVTRADVESYARLVRSAAIGHAERAM